MMGPFEEKKYFISIEIIYKDKNPKNKNMNKKSIHKSYIQNINYLKQVYNMRKFYLLPGDFVLNSRVYFSVNSRVYFARATSRASFCRVARRSGKQVAARPRKTTSWRRTRWRWSGRARSSTSPRCGTWRARPRPTSASTRPSTSSRSLARPRSRRPSAASSPSTSSTSRVSPMRCSGQLASHSVFLDF